MNVGNHNSCQLCTRGWSNFKNLTKEELELVNNHRVEARYKAGEVILKQGAPCSNIIFFTSGIAKVYLEGIDEKRIIIGFSLPGKMLVGPGLYVDNRHNYSLAALTDTSVCFIDSSIIKDLVLKNPKFAEGLIKDISFKSVKSFEQMLNLTQKKMHGRLSDGLLYLADKLFKKDKFENIISRQELGEFTNMTKESVVRILGEFHKEKIINIDTNSIEILDKKRLIQISISG